jgi:translation initiation factor IF-1
VGTYPITPTLSGAALANYTQNIVNGTLTVTKAAATITVNSTSRTYGAANPTFTGTITGALNGDVLTATYSATTATVTSSVGTYPITAVLTGTASGNYNATVVPGTLTVGQATLNIGVNSFTKVYGSVNPTFTGSVTGVLNGDSITTTYSTTATQYSPVNVGGYPITASISGAAASNYTAVVTPGTLTVTPAVVTVTINPATRIYGAANPTFTGTLAGVLNGDAVTGVYTTTATVLSYVGTYPITATLGGSAAGNYTANVIGANLTITAAPLMVTANSLTSVYGSALPTLGYTVTGFVNGDTVGSATTGAPTLGTSATSHSAVGSYPTTASLGSLAATNYNFQFVNGTLTITPATLTVTATNASRTYGTANPTFAYTITGFVNGDAQSVVGGSATETTVATPTTTVGNYAITFATEALTASNYTFNYVNGTLAIIQATPVISWSTPAAITYGTALSATQLNATSGGVAGTFTYSPTTGAVLTAGPQTLSVSFAPTDSTDYTNASGSVQLTVNKATPTITWATPAAITYGTALSSTQLNATSGGVNGTFTYSPLSGTVLDAGSQTLSVTFAPTNTTDYTSATGTVQLTVNKATPAISWSTPAAITYGTALSATQLDATSGGVAGTFGYSPAAGAVLTAGSQTLSVTFTPTDSTDYTTANGSVQLTVNQATPTMSWSTPAAITYGTALSSAQLNATSGGVNGTFTYTPASGTVLGAGTQTLSVTFKPTDTTDYVSATTTVQLTVSAAVPAIGWTAPAAIAYGTALSATQLDASSTVAGSFAYTPAAGVVLDPGTQTLSVTFTPTDIVDYTTATISVSLTVEPPASVYTAPAADVGAVIGGQTATILLPNGFTLGSIAVVTQGAPNLDFKFVSGGTCTVGSTYTADEVCTVNYSFNPTVPGLRIGAVNLYDNTTPTPVLQATVYLNGTGVGPQLVFNTPLTANSLGSGSGFNNPYGAAVDGSGNLYVADAGNNLVTERPAGCASLSCVTTLGGGFSRPTGVAVDGSGNVYVADQGNSAVKEMPSGCASSSCVTTLGGGFSRPTGVAVDGSGNVYVADQSNNAIKEMPSGCTTSGCVTTLGGNIPTPYAVAVDSSGNVWVPAGDNVLHEITPGCTSSSCVGALSLLSRSGAQSVALDGAGDIYIAEILPNDSNNVVLELPVGCTSASCVITVGSGLVHPVGLAVDGSGNLYVADEVGVAQGSVDGNVKEIARATAPSLSFATTPAGAISSDSPQTVTVENVGNAALTFPIPASGKDPSITTGFTLNSSASGACPLVTPTSSTPGSLAAGASCSLAISFKPVTSGSATGSLTLTDQNLNTPGPNYAVQSIQLSGNSTPGSPTINSVSAILPQQTQTITISGSGFGAQAAYTGDSNYIELVDTAGSSWQAGHAGSSVALAVSSWTDSQIVLSGFSGSYGTNGWCISPGDQLSFRVWNAQTGAGPAVYPITASSGTNTCTLAISSVSAILPQQTQTITINGSDFGTQAAYTGDSNYIELVDSSGTPWNAGHGTSAVTLAVSSWTNTQIVLSGLSGAYGTNGWCISPGDQLSVEVWNAQSGKGPAVYPITASSGTNTCVLAINSVSPILPQQTQTITINGTDFGTRAAYTGDSNYIELVDTTAGSWSAGHGVNAVTLAVSSWTNTQIVLSGFSGAYGTNGWCISPGDQLSVQIWNAQSGQGPAVYPVVASGGPNTCTLAINSVSQSFRSRRRPLPSTDQTSARRPPTPATRTTSS